MNKINFANIILISVAVFLFAGIYQVYAVTSAPNKTNITAEILSVQQIDPSSNFASNYVAILKIKVMKYESVEGTFSIPSELEAYVHRWTNDLATVSKLEKGQTITAIISYSGDERGGMWDIREIKISTSTKPVPTSTSVPVKIEVTATETAISGPQPTTAKLPVGCTRENETVTCPTSETKQITVLIMMSTNAPLEAITIQKQTDGTIGITSHEAVAVTTEKVTVEGNRLFIGPTESAKPVSVLPNQAKDTAITSAGLTSVAITELKTEEQRPVYTVQGARNSKLLFFIPISVKTTTKIDATSGKVISIQKPWWSFLVR